MLASSGGSRKNTRLDQIVAWCGGATFDGCIIFDECHRAKNCVRLSFYSHTSPHTRVASHRALLHITSHTSHRIGRCCTRAALQLQLTVCALLQKQSHKISSQCLSHTACIGEVDLRGSHTASMCSVRAHLLTSCRCPGMKARDPRSPRACVVCSKNCHKRACCTALRLVSLTSPTWRFTSDSGCGAEGLSLKILKRFTG